MRKWFKRLFIVLGVILGVILVKVFLIFQITVTNNTLRPTLIQGDRVLVSRLSYGLRFPFEYFWDHRYFQICFPQRGDLVAFNDPLERNPFVSTHSICLGKCIATPGDTLWLFIKIHQGNFNTHSIWLPFIVPHKGCKIKVTPWNQHLLANTLRLDEDANVCEHGDSFLIVNGNLLDTIEFSQDYLWISARGETFSYDSRIFGFLPITHVIGRVLCTSYSKDLSSNIITGYRPKRFMQSLIPVIKK